MVIEWGCVFKCRTTGKYFRLFLEERISEITVRRILYFKYCLKILKIIRTDLIHFTLIMKDSRWPLWIEFW